jgi:hypothetical protein
LRQIPSPPKVLYHAGAPLDGADLLKQSSLSTSEFNQVLTILEVGGKIRPLGANHWAIF